MATLLHDGRIVYQNNFQKFGLCLLEIKWWVFRDVNDKLKGTGILPSRIKVKSNWIMAHRKTYKKALRIVVCDAVDKERK